MCRICWDHVEREHPPLCAHCGIPLEPALGSAHRQVGDPAWTTGSLCVHCALTPSAVRDVRSIGPYVGTLRNIVHAMKYDGRRSLAKPLGALMRDAGGHRLAACEAAIPVPLHPHRRRERGFNQAHDLARQLGLPVVTALARSRHTDTQTALPAADRHANVSGAFRTTRRVRALAGCSVVLVDDVRTTGATLEACAVVLKDSGVREVFALTAARVATPRA